MITFNNVSLQRGTKMLFQAVNLVLHARQKIGLVGKNGAGKTSLFLMLLHQLDPNHGELLLASHLNIVSVEQEISTSARSALDFVIDADQHLRQLQLDLQQAEINQDGNQIATLYMQLEDLGGFTAETRAAKILSGLAFSSEQMRMPVNALSGGWRMRLNIARALFVPSDVLLLDEPTNHLDLDAVIWLERWLMQYPGTLLLISHDRDFLDRMVTHVAHIEHQQIKFYTGNYSSFEKQRAEALALQQKQYEKQQQHIAHIQSYIDRFRAKASKAKQAQSRVKALERMQKIMPAHVDTPFSFEFREPRELGNPLLNLEGISFGYDDALVLQDIDFQIHANDRIALLGKNGAGKSTFIKVLAGQLLSQQGQILKNQHLKIGYFAQHSLEQLNIYQSPLAHLQAIDQTTKDLSFRSFLGGFDFAGDMALTPVETFSGGEKARLALALIIWQNPHLLLLDEPTNHLDLDMRQALILALQNYSGAVIVVSHDRFLLRNIVDDYYLVHDKKITLFDDGLDYYQTWVLQNHSSAQNNKIGEKINRKAIRQQEAAYRNQLSPLKNKIKAIEKQLREAQIEMKALEAQLADETIYKNKNQDQFTSLLIERGVISKQIHQLEEEWLLLHEQLERLERG